MHKLHDELNSGWNDKSTRFSASLEKSKFTFLQNSVSNVLQGHEKIANDDNYLQASSRKN